jgi:hypothetical protein
MLKCRDVFLRIEPVPAYSPVAPDGGEHGAYGRDCMRNHGHEDARIPGAEVLRGKWTRWCTGSTPTPPMRRR